MGSKKESVAISAQTRACASAVPQLNAAAMAFPAAAPALPGAPLPAGPVVPAAASAPPGATTRMAALPAAASALPLRVTAAAGRNGRRGRSRQRQPRALAPATEDDWRRRFLKRQGHIDMVKASQLYTDCQLAVAQGTWLLMPTTPRADEHTSKRWWEKQVATWREGLRLRAPLSAAPSASFRSRSAP